MLPRILYYRCYINNTHRKEFPISDYFYTFTSIPEQNENSSELKTEVPSLQP